MKVIGIEDHTIGSHRRDVVRRLTARLGGTMSLRVPTDADIIVAWRFGLASSGLASTLVMLDRGIFDENRTSRFSIHIDAPMGLGRTAEGVMDLPPRPHPRMSPYADHYEFVQILAPSEVRHGLAIPGTAPPPGWLQKTTDEAIAAFGKPVKIKYHPRATGRGMPDVPLKNTFGETCVSISYASKAAIQTVVAGVPTIVQHPMSLAYSVASQDMQIVTPDREAWIHDLSYREYDFGSEDELDAASSYVSLFI